jgi:carboxypeptidase Taq
LAALAEIIHEKATDSCIPQLVAQSLMDLQSRRLQELTLDFGDASRILELTQKSYEKNVCIPTELERKRAELSASAYSAWVKARQANDYSSFEPVLRDCFQTAMDVATAQKKALKEADTSLYNTMLDDYEMGMSSVRLDSIFSYIQSHLVPLYERVLNSKHSPVLTPLSYHTFPVAQQEALSKDVVVALGYDMQHGRMDVSVHPFSTSFSSADVRITSRFREDEWYQGLAGSIHEAGHAMYEQNLPSETLALEINEALSMGMHESQSLFWERHVGLSKEFWSWLRNRSGLLTNKFDGYLETFTAEELYGAVNAISSPSLIRVEADELTYPLHVILRYQIERDVVEGTLHVKDIPARWNQEMKSMLNVVVPNDTKGCLQDVHWSGLAIGYFPTYLLGSATAAQLAHYCQQDIPDMYQQIERGEFRNIKTWLTNKVHRHGKRYSSLDELLKGQLGEELNPEYFIQYLTKKYTDLYKC